MADTLREVLEAGYDEMDAAPEPTPAEPEPQAEAAPTEPVSEEAPPPAPSSERARDPATGQFVKTEEIGTKVPKPVEIGKAAAAPEGAQKAGAGKTAAVARAPGDGAAPPTVPSPEPASTVKPPQAWSPAAREAFAKAPEAVQREVEKREREITRALSDTAQARQLAQSVHQTLAPFEGLARSQGMDAMSYAGSVLQTAAALHMGTPQQKAAIVANLIATYGIDVDGVNQAMQNPQAAPPVQQQPARPPVDPREEVRRILAEERVMAEAQEFLANPPEFYDTVKDDMHEILRLDRARGGNMTPKAAYERAVKFSEEVQGIVAQRKAAEDAKKKAAESAAARAAAGSVRTVPMGVPKAQPKGRRAVLEAGYDDMDR